MDNSPHERHSRFTDSSFLKLCREEHQEIERHKWIESEKAGHDIGVTTAVHDWLRRHERRFRAEQIELTRKPEG